MSAFILTLWMGLFVFIGLLLLFVWSCYAEQWDDLETPAERILWEDHHEER